MTNVHFVQAEIFVSLHQIFFFKIVPSAQEISEGTKQRNSERKVKFLNAQRSCEVFDQAMIEIFSDF